jgi:pantetheine-phosphate adenylyltransferase
MRRAIYPGSFDPPHNGHLDVLRRAACLFDEVIVAVAFNDQKRAMLTAPERVELLNQCAGRPAKRAGGTIWRAAGGVSPASRRRR